MNETKTNTGATVYKEVCEFFEKSIGVNVTQGFDDVIIKKRNCSEMFCTHELRFLFSVMTKYDCRMYIASNLNGQLTAVLWKWWRK